MFTKNVSLIPHSNLRIGGLAEHFCEPRNIEEVISAVEYAKKNNLPIFTLGGGTNLLIHDDGIKGLVMKPKLEDVVRAGDSLVSVGAGVSVKKLLEVLTEHELSGLEWAGGLPGTVGGAVWGNAGAFGGEIKDSVKEVLSLDISGDEPKLYRRKCEDCDFSYRNSIFKRKALEEGSPEIILGAIFNLKPGSRSEIEKIIQEKQDYRKRKQPLEHPNIGSIFKNIDVRKVPEDVLKRFEHKIKHDPFPVLPVAVLIDSVGLRGVSFGGAMVSPKHPNFIVNALSASSEDVRKLAYLVQGEVKDKLGIELEREVLFL